MASLIQTFQAVRRHFTRDTLNKKATRAALEGDFETAINLVKKGADPNYFTWRSEPIEGGGSTDYLESMAYEAIVQRNTKALNAFLECGLNKNLICNRCTLLDIAISNKNEDAALLLISRGAAFDLWINGPNTAYWHNPPYEVALENGLTNVANAMYSKFHPGQARPTNELHSTQKPSSLSP